jgi:hypothetical protein
MLSLTPPESAKVKLSPPQSQLTHIFAVRASRGKRALVLRQELEVHGRAVQFSLHEV